jgi:hypothetical protein
LILFSHLAHLAVDLNAIAAAAASETIRTRQRKAAELDEQRRRDQLEAVKVRRF